MSVRVLVLIGIAVFFVLISLVTILVNLVPERFHPDSWFGPAVYASLGITGFVVWWVIRKERT